jgi:hypothetical protein
MTFASSNLHLLAQKRLSSSAGVLQAPSLAQFQGVVLVAEGVVAARDELVSKGIEMEEVFHDEKGLFYHAHKTVDTPGPDSERKSYRSFTAFSDPDGNGWIIQEVKDRLSGR